MGKYDRITMELGKLGGKPCIRGMRISVARVLRLVSAYPCFADIMAEFPELEEEHIRQALRYAADGLDGMHSDGAMG